ncbi:MAG: FAD-binding protein, partial [Deltaproteobacteria bacterium]|nr:FAD-binding protein [Deltaproteobacteria bacterium]
MDFPGFSLDISALQSDGGPNPDAIYDVLVIGGGPAAMTAAVYAARKMLKLALLTKD